MKKTILTLLITLCPILAFASDYIYLGSSDVNNIYVNNDITLNDGIYRAWVKFTYRNTKAGIAEKIHNAKSLRLPSLSYVLILKEFDIEKKQSRNIATYIYRKDGTLIDNKTDEYGEFEYIVPNSVEEVLLNFVSNQMDKKTSIHEEKDRDEKIYEVVEQMPAFQGGQGALMTYINKELKYPAEAQTNGIQGRVTVSFVIEEDGSITNATVVRSINPDLDKEALRVINSMPKWIPGKNNGRNVRVRFNVPVQFKLQ